MTEEKTHTPAPIEAEGNYRYYMIAGDLPARLKFNENGQRCLVEIPEEDRPGQLKADNRKMSVIMKGDYADEISKEEFVKSANNYADYMKKKNIKKKKTPLPGLDR